ncbi:MAG: polyhydroxyalkanoic acid system family protein [Vulcanimicrobiota bacterium]
MPGFNVTVKHALPHGEACLRMKQLLQQMKSEYAGSISDLSENWNDCTCRFHFKMMGTAVSGEIDINSADVKISGGLPFTAMLFKGQIESTIFQKTAHLLA